MSSHNIIRKIYTARSLFLLMLLISVIYCNAQSIPDTLKINLELNGKQCVKNGLILSSEVNFFKKGTNENIRDFIQAEQGDSTFLLIRFRKNHEVILGFRNNGPCNILISKSKVILTWPYLYGYFKLKYYCKPYYVSFPRSGGVTEWRQPIMNRNCNFKSSN